MIDFKSIDFNLDMEHAILTVRPAGALSEQDFRRVAAAVDPFIEQRGDLAGLIIHAESFPGWENFAGLLGHLRFVRDYHRHIRKIAVVSDTTVLTYLPRISAHFIDAEIRHFHYDDYEQAVAWIATADPESAGSAQKKRPDRQDPTL
jgi:hypothetical protein